MTFLLPRRLVGLALLAVFAVSAQAQVASRALQVDSHAGVHILRAGPNGGLVCDEATEAEATALANTASRPASEMRLTALPSLNAPGVGGFRIILRATDQLLARPEALLAFRRAAARWERIIQNPVTTVIDVDYGPERFNGGLFAPNVLGSTSSAIEFATASTATTPGAGPAEMVAAFKAAHPNDAQLQALYNAIPVPTPSTAPAGTGGRDLGRAIGNLITLQVLGFRPDTIDPNDPERGFGRVAAIGFNSAFAYDFDPGNGITAGQTDFEGVAIHEIGHALGFTSNIGTGVTNTNNPIQFTPWDLFRVRPEAVTVGEPLNDGLGFERALRVITPGPINADVLAVENGVTYFKAVQTTFTGTAAYETSTATGSRLGGDGQQASHWRDDALRPPSLGANRVIGIMDPNIGAGQLVPIKTPDIRLLEVIGYTVDYNPPTARVDLRLNGVSISQALIVPEQRLGDVQVGGTRTVALSLANADLSPGSNPLVYEVEVELDTTFPEGLTPTVTVSPAQGTVVPGARSDLSLTFGGVNQPAFVSGRLLIRTNDGNRAFLEVPFTFGVGGATEPRLAVTTTLPASGSLGNIAPTATPSFTVNVGNTGSLPLDYKVFASVSTRELPLTTVPAAGRPASRLAGLYARGAARLFAADFENPADLSQFIYSQTAAPDRWQRVTGGKAALAGHSSPGVAYFGQTGGVFAYSDNSLGQLSTPVFDLSTLTGDNLVTVSFNYYLAAEAGFDFASLVYSIDGGKTFDDIVTSDGGALTNTPDGWKNIVVDVPGVAGFPEVQFGFRFSSDGGVTDEGFYIDDVEIATVPGGSGFFATPVTGTVAGRSSVPVTVTVNAAALERGFYDGFVDVETNQRGADPAPIDIQFTIGNPLFPSIAAVSTAPSFSVAPDQQVPVELSLRNPGDAPLSFVRVLEPAASSYAEAPNTLAGDDIPARDASVEAVLSADVVPDGDVDAAARTLADGDITAMADLPGAALLGDLAQLPDGRILVLDIGTASVPGSYGQGYLLSEDLATLTRIPSVLTAQQSGIAYNSRTGTLWIAELSAGRVREFRLGGTTAAPTFVATGTSFLTGFSPVGLSYSPELDAFFTTGFNTSGLYAIDTDGNVLPGYPVGIAGRANQLPGLSFTNGLVEVGGANLSILQTGQFGRTFTGGVTVTETSVRLGGSPRINGYHRSQTDPNGAAYYVANPANGVSRVFRVDPPNLPASVSKTRILAAEPLYSDQAIEPSEAFALPLIIDAKGLTRGTYTDQIAFLTNNPTGQLVRIPVTIEVTGGTSTETGEVSEFAFGGLVPNPVRGAGRVRFTLPEASDVTVSVYNVLGQRVAVLADGQAMTAGAHEVPFSATGLAAGLYVVRLEAGGSTGTQKITVVR